MPASHLQTPTSVLNFIHSFPHFPLCLLLLLLITVAGWPGQSSKGKADAAAVVHPSLYSAADRPLTILSTANFSRFVVDLHADGRRLQLVQFYNSFCGHCISFAPSFRQFLRSITRWTELLSVAAVDCSIESNRPVCTDYDVEFYPTLRMFWFRPAGKAQEKGDNLHLGGKQEAADLRQHVLKWITDNWKRGNISAGWPQFPPLTADSKEALVEKLKKESKGGGGGEGHGNQTVLIFVEKDASFFGREMMMNLSRYSGQQLRLYRMVESNIRLLDQILPRSLDHFQLPFIVHFRPKDGQFNVLLKPVMIKTDPGEYFGKVIREEFLKNVVEAEEPVEEVAPVTDGTKHELQQYSSRVFMSDLNNAIRFALFHEVPMRKYLSLEQVDALIRFLGVLYENYHFQEEKTKKFVESAQKYLQRKLNTLKKEQAGRGGGGKAVAAASKPIRMEVEDLLESLKMYEDYFHLPEMKPWRACAEVAGSPGKRAYPCSLWTLFHVLTVAEYRRSVRQRSQWASLHASLYAMRGYVTAFFGCTDCARHFGAMASGLENELTVANASVLWLWAAHNSVNARLKGGASEVAALPKRQFPTFKECPQCYKAEPPSSPDDPLLRNATLYRQRYYDEPKVLQFLVEFYAAERLVPDKSEYDLVEGGEELGSVKKVANEGYQSGDGDHHHNPSHQSHSKPIMLSFVPFTSTDYSIIIVFYFVSVALLLSLCAFFKIRRARNSRKPFSLLP
ncbi:PREDICTED: sulfhydryl oxidase 1-like [Rhagoletis zephyria]|uniref:sulfhydryl oxidase 1-like n=1 Tax=Rhagoletis zephyria TaxID=28612 RepID=UPI00081162B9|nr:PREDICTED: sulfhydryl oxidase 1-like [Rhagoletis zephyria]